MLKLQRTLFRGCAVEDFGPMEVGLRRMSRMEMVSIRIFRNILRVLWLFRTRENLLPVDRAGSCGGCGELLCFMVYVHNVSLCITFETLNISPFGRRLGSIALGLRRNHLWEVLTFLRVM